PNTGDLQGVLTFSNFNSVTVGNEFANLLLGYIQSYQQDSAQQKYYNSYKIIEPYFQDDWKVNSRLTLNLGVRFSLFGNYHEENHAAWNWDPTKFVAPDNLTFFQDGRLRLKGNKPVPIDPNNPSPIITNGLVQCGVSGVPDTCMEPHWFNPAPRVGFAWDPRGDGKTSIRGGYGLFFEHGTGSEANTGSLVGSAPLNLTMTQLTPSGVGLSSGYPCIGGIGGTASNCFSGQGAYPIDVTSIPRETIWPYVQQWSFGVQRELSRSLVFGISYVGSKGTHLTAVRQPNAFPLGPQEVSDGIQLSGNPYGLRQPIINSSVFQVFDCTNRGNINNPTFQVNGVTINKTQPAYLNLLAACEGLNAANLPPINSRRPFLGIQKIFSLENVADSNYHALQATLRRTRGPLTVDISYSYSHSIDDSSDRNDTTTVNPLVVSTNKASSNFDQRHLINVAY
ncbi:MAG: carboxypeptidase regulatory-like domain-containing protein, partial [Nitrospirales bacterium]